MACSRAELTKAASGQAGYATVAALGVSLAVALLAGALVLSGVSALKLARSDFARSQAQYALSGAQVLATATVLNSSGVGRLAWSAEGVDGRPVVVLAEAEGGKLALSGAAGLSDETLTLLGAADPGQARGRLAALDPKAATPDQVEAADATGDWRVCATSAISPWGASNEIRLGPTKAPNREAGGVRAGQVWRIRVTTSDGWTDEQIVRLIGQAQTPSAVIWRRFGREASRGVTCDKAIGN